MFKKLKTFLTLLTKPLQLLNLLMMRHIEYNHFKELVSNLQYNEAIKKASLKYYNKINFLLPAEAAPNVIEVACGPGRYLSILSALKYKITGVDINDYREWEYLRKHTSVNLIPFVNAEKLPFEDNSFNQGLCIGALFYFDNPKQALLELQRVVKPGGRIILSTVNSLSNHSKACTINSRVDSNEQLKSNLEAMGFIIKESFTYGYAPPILKKLWSYIYYCFMPMKLYDWLNNLIDEKKRPVVVFLMENNK